MNAEKQVASLENSKRLLGLGVRLDTYFDWTWWQGYHPEGDDGCYQVTHGPAPRGYELALTHISTAPTFAEIAEVLPRPLWDGGMPYLPRLTIRDDGFDEKCEIHYASGAAIPFPAQWADTPADAACLMLIWLIENGHLTAEEIAG